CLAMAFVFDIFMLVTGFGNQGGNELGMSRSEELIVRMMLATLVIAVNGIILYGALQMKGLKSLGMAKTACYLALIPCCGPCYILGIPFGIWGLVVLSDPQVQQAFKE